jgi:hypothetical protein
MKHCHLFNYFNAEIIQTKKKILVKDMFLCSFSLKVTTLDSTSMQGDVNSKATSCKILQYYQNNVVIDIYEHHVQHYAWHRICFKSVLVSEQSSANGKSSGAKGSLRTTSMVTFIVCRDLYILFYVKSAKLTSWQIY